MRIDNDHFIQKNICFYGKWAAYRNGIITKLFQIQLHLVAYFLIVASLKWYIDTQTPYYVTTLLRYWLAPYLAYC